MYNQEIEQECPYDCFELIDWAIENHPEFYESIRYCHFDVIVGAVIELWFAKQKENQGISAI